MMMLVKAFCRNSSCLGLVNIFVERASGISADFVHPLETEQSESVGLGGVDLVLKEEQGAFVPLLK